MSATKPIQNLSKIGSMVGGTLNFVSKESPFSKEEVDKVSHNLVHQLIGIPCDHPLEAGITSIISEEILAQNSREEQDFLIESLKEIGKKPLDSNFWVNKDFSNFNVLSDILSKLQLFISKNQVKKDPSPKPDASPAPVTKIPSNTCTPSQWKEIFNELSRVNEYYCVRPQCHGDCGKPYKDPEVNIQAPHTCNDPNCNINHEASELAEHEKPKLGARIGAYAIATTFALSFASLIYMAFSKAQQDDQKKQAVNLSEQVSANQIRTVPQITSSLQSRLLLSSNMASALPKNSPGNLNGLALQATAA